MVIEFPDMVVSCDDPSQYKPSQIINNVLDIDYLKYLMYAADFIETKVRPFEAKENLSTCKLLEWPSPTIAFECWKKGDWRPRLVASFMFKPRE